MRVAVSQFATSSSVQENLATCIRMIHQAAVCKPLLIVFPEFSNTMFNSVPFCNAKSGYLDHNHSWNEALTIDGPFLQCIAEQSKKYNCYIVINVTIRRATIRAHQDSLIKSNISVTSCLFSPSGDLIQQVDKQKLIGYEKDFFMSGKKASEVVTTPFGNLGLLAGSESQTYEASRELVLNGAQILCNSINTFALDQTQLHDPTRACENKVFLVSANKVGSLVSQVETIQQEQVQGIMIGVGQSQIVSPNGKVLAKIEKNEEGFVFADIDLEECGLNNKKLRPDGTDLIKQRRPELYQGLEVLMSQSLNMKQLHERENEGRQRSQVPATANVAIFSTYKSDEQAIEDVRYYIENNLSDIIQLPELFFIADKAILNNVEQRAAVAYLSQQLVNQISSVLRPFQYVCTSVVIEGQHQAVLISERGVFAIQQQLHYCQRYQWTALGNDLNIIELPLEQGNINVAMLTADDANIPEIVKVAALNNIQVLLVPFDIQTSSEVEYSLLARAVENRICIVAASREKSFTNDLLIDNGNKNTQNKKKIKSYKSTGLIVNLTTDGSLLTQWKSSKFNGYTNPPLVKYQQGKITKAVIHPIAACCKFMTSQTL